jgi:thiosulfate reductase cytochrome b subunit
MHYEPGIGALPVRIAEAPRRLLVVRITHWIAVLSVFALLASGIGILVSHPRLYWGETGNLYTPSLIDLPIPFIIGPSIWNRPIHFFSAWILVLTGLTYVVAGCITRHFWRDLLPAKDNLRWSRIRGVLAHHMRGKRESDDDAWRYDAWRYNVAQQLTYLAVLFGLFPAIIWTGLAMSFGITSVFPVLATALGGHQSARTLHFITVSLLVLFLIVDMVMLWLVGFSSHMRAMITGYIPQRRTAP